MSEYKRTLFDRHGPGALDRVRALVYGAMAFGITLGLLLLAMGLTVQTFVWAVAAGAGTAGASFFLAKAAGDGWTRVALSGATTPYEEQHSYQQALVMQGKVDEALASYEELASAAPNDFTVRIRAADLYATRREGARRAAELFREAQRIPTLPAGQDIYVTNRLVDLLMGPLAEPGRALVELRRLIERYPKTAAAAHAREALARLKRSVASDT